MFTGWPSTVSDRGALSSDVSRSWSSDADRWSPAVASARCLRRRAAGQAAASDWDSLVAERILRPLGMDGSNTSALDCREDERVALGYRWEAERQAHAVVPMRRVDNIAPAGAINSSARDMARWLRFQLGRGALEGQRLISTEQHWSAATQEFG